MKSMWEGSISFGLVSIPVQVFPATNVREISFHLLHKEDKGRIHNQRICDVCGESVEYADLVKGYEYEKDHFVTLTPDDFEKVNIEKAKTIDILDFVDEEEVDPMFFDKPYYLVPEKNGKKAYILLREALKQSQKVGIAKLVFRTKENLAAIKAKGNALMLDTMYFASEIRDSKELKLPNEKNENKKELEVAKELIDQMTTKFDAEKYNDTYEENLRELIDKKIKGKEPKAKVKMKQTTNVIDIMSKLKASLKNKKMTKVIQKHKKRSA